MAPGDALDKLIDQYLEVCESARNRAKSVAPEPRFTVYLENIGWAQFFDYDMNRYLTDAAFQLEMQLRERLYHWEHFDDDTVLVPHLNALAGYYPEYTLFDMPVRHERVGVPHIRDDHPMTRDPDLRLLHPHDFMSSGLMPDVIRVWEQMTELAGDRLSIGFHEWHRGPLDMAVQLRGYANFVADTVARPQFVHDLMRFLVDERIRWWEIRTRFLGTKPDAVGISDDWVNVPFISPAMFEDFCLPRYLELEEYHGAVNRFHSCGNKAPLVHLVMRIKTLDRIEVNHWTPLDDMLAAVPRDKWIDYSFQNLDVLRGSADEQEAKVRAVVEACQGRRCTLCGQALQRTRDDYATDMAQIKQFIRVARGILGRAPLPEAG